MGYFGRARRRAANRQSPWNLLLIPLFLGPWVGLTSIAVMCLQALHRLVHPGQDLWQCGGVGTILTVIGPLLATLVPAAMVANAAGRLIGPARRVFDQEAAKVSGRDFRSIQTDLLLKGWPLVLGGLVCGSPGAIIQWKC